MGKFLLGIIVGIALIIVVAYVFILEGGVPMNVSANSLPMEQFLAHTAIVASMGKAGHEQPSVPADEANLLAGAHIYQTNGCAGCHGRIDDPNSGGGKNFYPLAPHLLPPSKGVTDDEVGETHWVVKNGIHFSAMPTYNNRLSDTELWQVSLLLHNANQLPA
jgi:thiosulfate dehydrogenase